jgi:hypothetical protein
MAKNSRPRPYRRILEATKKADAKSVWNSLEVAKLIVSTSSAIVVAIVGAMLTHQFSLQTQARDDALRAQSREIATWDRIFTKRSETWDKIAEPLTDVFNGEYRICLIYATHQNLNTKPSLKEINDLKLWNEDLRGKTRKIGRLFAASSPYFTKEISDSVSAFVADSLVIYARSVDPEHPKVGQHCEEYRTSYDKLIDVTFAGLGFRTAP